MDILRTRTELNFPVGKIQHRLSACAGPKKRVTDTAAINMAAILEYFTTEVCVCAQNWQSLVVALLTVSYI